jgi:hypothetical protein
MSAKPTHRKVRDEWGGLVRRPEDWAWSSFRHYLSGIEGVVEIESQWTALNRERMGFVVEIGSHPPALSQKTRQGRGTRGSIR